ncbi:heavy-metal-associated domain-containing protein [Streptomyces fructofermentans]|uniref:Metal-binding protein n=1 Tax=Streptomyces fructofermentans TaxID=152141 RepID=A0A918KBG6_9ACTN|nr:heavy-metal-associated domain-containing protein [Streptomyces fructofermentans]GGX57445.1 metal-binding protein [Streptomyces fructofermentans]
MTEQRYHVIGMTCDRCAGALETRVGSVHGVLSVGIDLDSGAVTVTGEALDGSRICAAITEAGFEVAAVL